VRERVNGKKAASWGGRSKGDVKKSGENEKRRILDGSVKGERRGLV